ncbi:MAG: hypothetical protein H6737_26600 [Alphaproteobacteria bacterium]|nr:hypothetical protein [Alphaproteobacteria bacterium]
MGRKLVGVALIALACKGKEPEGIGVDFPDAGPNVVELEASDDVGAVTWAGTDDGETVVIDAMAGSVDGTAFEATFEGGVPTASTVGGANWAWQAQGDGTFDATWGSAAAGTESIAGIRPDPDLLGELEAQSQARVVMTLPEGAPELAAQCIAAMSLGLVLKASRDLEWTTEHRRDVQTCLDQHPDFVDQVVQYCTLEYYVIAPLAAARSQCDDEPDPQKCRRRLDAAVDHSRDYGALVIGSLEGLALTLGERLDAGGTCPWGEEPGDLNLTIEAVRDTSGADALIGGAATLPLPATFDLRLVDAPASLDGATVSLSIGGTAVVEEDLLLASQSLVLPAGAMDLFTPTPVTARATLSDGSTGADTVTVTATPDTREFDVATITTRLMTTWTYTDGSGTVTVTEQTGNIAFGGTEPQMAGTWNADGTVFDSSWDYDDQGVQMTGAVHLELSATRDRIDSFSFEWGRDDPGPAVWTRTLTGGGIPFSSYTAGSNLRYVATDIGVDCTEVTSFTLDETLFDGGSQSVEFACVPDSSVTIALFPL